MAHLGGRNVARRSDRLSFARRHHSAVTPATRFISRTDRFTRDFAGLPSGVHGTKVVVMMKKIAIAVLALGVVARVSAQERNTLASFDGGIGVIPVTGAALNPDGTLQSIKLNVVRGVPPGAGPWRIGSLHATVDFFGHIDVRGRGLLLASGNSIGQNANQRVFATLICEASTPFTQHNTSTAGVPLAPNGDFEIDDVLNPIPTDCASPVLLIRNTVGTWFAAGIPSSDDNN